MYFSLFIPLLYFYILFSAEGVFAQQLVTIFKQNNTWKCFGMLVTDMFLSLLTEITWLATAIGTCVESLSCQCTVVWACLSLFLHVLIFRILCHQLLSSYSVLLSTQKTAVLAQKATPRIICKTSYNNIKLRRNITFVLNLFRYFIIALILAWLVSLLLILPGSVHPNPGPCQKSQVVEAVVLTHP